MFYRLECESSLMRPIWINGETADKALGAAKSSDWKPFIFTHYSFLQYRIQFCITSQARVQTV